MGACGFKPILMKKLATLKKAHKELKEWVMDREYDWVNFFLVERKSLDDTCKLYKTLKKQDRKKGNSTKSFPGKQCKSNIF